MELTGKLSARSIRTALVKRGTGIGMVLILLILGLRANLFFAPENLMVVLKQSSVLSLVALGLTMVLVSGGFDMGAGALVQFSGNVAAGLIISGLQPMITVPVGIAIGLVSGLVNSFLVIIVRIPSFVATLGSMFVLMGLTTLYNGGKALTIQIQPGFTFLGQGSVGPVPMIFVIVIAIAALMHLFLKGTRTGLRMYATGENPAAASLRGIRTRWYQALGYCLSGAILGLTGVLQCSYSYGASAVASGMDSLIQALSAAYLGSTFSKTGELSVVGTVLSGIFIAALSNVLIINGVSNQQIAGILGFILILSILITVINKREIGQVTIF